MLLCEGVHGERVDHVHRVPVPVLGKSTQMLLLLLLPGGGLKARALWRGVMGC